MFTKSSVYKEVLQTVSLLDTKEAIVTALNRRYQEALAEENGEVDLMFLQSAYNLTSKTVRGRYHIKLYHADYDGWFDWYVTTGTIVPNSTERGASKRIGKSKDAEEVAIIITNHIKKCFSWLEEF